MSRSVGDNLMAILTHRQEKSPCLAVREHRTSDSLAGLVYIEENKIRVRLSEGGTRCLTLLRKTNLFNRTRIACAPGLAVEGWAIAGVEQYHWHPAQHQQEKSPCLSVGGYWASDTLAGVVDIEYNKYVSHKPSLTG